MDSKISKPYYLIPFLYAAVIVALLYMQFSGSRPFTAEVNDITISGKAAAGAPGREITYSEMNVLCNGLDFSFGKDNPVKLHSRDGLTHRTVPLDYRVTASGVDVILSKGLTVSFFVSGEDDNHVMIDISADDHESIRKVSLPFSALDGIEISRQEGIPVLSINDKAASESCFIALPDSALFNSEENSLVLFPEEKGFAELVFEESAGGLKNAFSYWFSGNSTLATEQQMKEAVSSFVKKSTEAMYSQRFESSAGRWKNQDGRSVFNEEAMMQISAEKTGSPDFARIREELSVAADLNTSSLTVLSSPLYGNIVNEGWRYDTDMKEMLPTITDSALKGDRRVFLEPGLSNLYFSTGSDELLSALKAITASAVSKAPEVSEAAGMIRFYLDLKKNRPGDAAGFESALKLVDSSIIPALKVADGKLLLQTAENTMDTYLSVIAGKILIEAAAPDDDDTRSLGYELIESVMALSDDKGFIPAVVKLDNKGDISFEGTVNPERIYPLVTESPYYPSEEFFRTTAGDWITVWNTAADFNMSRIDGGYKLTFNYPAGKIHSFAIRNMGPFDQINLLGYKWNGDHRFQQYFSGWWYDKNNRTLYMKIRHRTETEEVLIYTTPPAVQQ